MNARCDAHHDGHDCRQPGACQRALAAMCERGRDRGEREAIPPNAADLVLTLDEWRAKYPDRLVA